MDKIEPKGCVSGADGSAPDEPPVLRRVVVGGEAVVGVHPVGGRASVREIAPQGQLRVVQLGGVVGRCCHRHDAAGPEEEQHFIQRTAQVVVPGGEDFLVVVVHAAQAEHLHRLRQIDHPAMGILGVEGRGHQPFAEQELVLYLAGVGVGGVIKGQRAEVGAVFKRGLHEFAVQVGQQGVAQVQHPADGGQHLREAVVFLHPGPDGGVVTHQRRQEAEFQPAQGKVRRGVRAEAAQVGTGIQKAAHLHTGHHLDVGQQLPPGGVVVAQPDAAVPVRTDHAGTAVQQHPLFRVLFCEGFARCAGHAAAVEVVHPVVTDLLAVHFVVEAGIVFGAVHQAHRAAHDLAEKFLLLDVVLFAQSGHGVQKGPEPVRRVEEGRFVHVVPEALDAKVGQNLVPPAEPFPHLWPQEIGKVGLAGPDRRHEGGAVGLFAEVAFFQPLFAGRVGIVDADPRVDDGHQPDALRLQLIGELFQVGETLPVDGEIGVALHVVDVHADHIQRQAVCLVLVGDLPHIFFGLIAPAALRQTERPLRRDVAAPDEGTELFAERVLVPAGEDVQLVVRLLSVEAQRVVPGVADVIMDFSGEIHKETEAVLSISDEQKIVRTIVRKLVLGVVRFIGVVGDVMPAALVQPAGHLAQAIDDAVFPHPIRPAFGGRGQKGDAASAEGEHLLDAPGGDGMSERKSLDHDGTLLYDKKRTTSFQWYDTAERRPKQGAKPAEKCNKTGVCPAAGCPYSGCGCSGKPCAMN